MDLGFMDVEGLQRYVTDSGKIQPRRFSGLTPKQQRHVSRQIKRARQLLLMK
ncbi:MAG: 30S ribosomal protein S18 [Opitutales bacterium]|nr:30S ribosomal protein S18 [Opitutales bacterium]